MSGLCQKYCRTLRSSQDGTSAFPHSYGTFRLDAHIVDTWDDCHRLADGQYMTGWHWQDVKVWKTANRAVLGACQVVKPQ